MTSRAATLLFALSVALAPPARAATEVLFRLLPRAELVGADTPADRFLPDGEIRLYRPGEHEPRRIVRANQPTVLPAGEWQWIGEAPGWVTAEVGTLTSSTASARQLTVVGLLEPACEISLGEAKAWAGTERVDFVSLDHGVTYALPIDFRSVLQIPAGRWLAYSVGPRGLVGITKPRTCSGEQAVRLNPITPPGRNFEEWMVRVEIPDGIEARREDFHVVARSPLCSGPPPLGAGASVWNGRHGTFFFFDITVAGDRFVTLRHPTLRTLDHVQSSVGGRAVEVGPLAPKPRRSLTVTIDYRPARPHGSAVLVLADCGLRPVVQPDCHDRARFERRLRPGIAEYRFENLDDGQYRFDAEIDDEIVSGLGENLNPRLEPQDHGEPAPLTAELRELHVFGNLLEDGESVPGFVRLYSPPESRRAETLLPTDHTGLFHLFYFGHRPREGHFEAGIARQIPPESRCLDPERRLSACASDGGCRLFNGASSIVGEGRWDIELGEAGTIEIVVTEAADGTPVPNAFIALPPSAATYFIAGRVVEHLVRRNQWADSITTDAAGRAVVHWRGVEPVVFTVLKRGFSNVEGEIQPRPGKAVTVEVQLPREDGGGG